MRRRVVVSGVGVVSALGVGGACHWSGLLSGRSAVSRVERLTHLGFPVDVAAEVPPDKVAESLSRLSRKQLKLYNRATMLAMTAATLAAEDAGLTAPVTEGSRAGVILGTLFIPYPIQSILRLLPGQEAPDDPYRMNMGRALKTSMKSVNPLDMSLKIVPNLTGGHIAITYGLRGFCRTVSDGSTGGMHAIGQAMMAIREGELDVVFCGGTESPLEDLVFADLCATDLLAEPDDLPERTCRPFGRRRKGMVAGEGAAVLVLEAEDHARQRGVRLRAEIAGFGAAIGERSLAGIQASGQRAMQAAFADSQRDGVDLVSANGDGGRLNDQAEAGAIHACFETQARPPAVYATKGAHGNLFSAAGPLEVATAVMALEQEVLPPSFNGDDPDPDCGLRLSGDAPQALAGARTALVNALGAFGEATSLVVAKAT
ncbi:MAG TPA: beta-ketoacyl synthase N-terminal-like domain-containing protein [Candidatus Methylomirabilis sp.]|nr:beta-ketoacyl synthase N-terminal-like domain-containing protein [Candidatus Methylomirabilis sp.]